MAQKPSIPKGTRDFSPSEVYKRNYIFDVVKKHFQTFGFQPIETPSFENSDTLMGKYGDEGDRLIFKIIDSGNIYEKKLSEDVENAISIFVALTYIFRDVTTAILEDIDRYNLEFATREELYEIIKGKNLLKHYDNKLEEWGHFLIDDYKYRIAFTDKLNAYREVFLSNCVEFIYGRGIDFKQVRDKSDLSEHYFKWADRHVVKQFTTDIFGKIEGEIPNINKLTSDLLVKKISEKALRYDLTVPFARYVVMHQNEIDFPFKRYQIQPVWRADRPQKGRFREFYQCDADVVGANSLLQEVELIQLYDAVFTDLGLKGTTIKLNNRKILSGIAEVIGAKHLLVAFTVALDKLDKIGEEGVKKEMLEKGISEQAIQKATPLFSLSGSNSEQLLQLKELLKDSEEGSKGVQELDYIISSIEELGLQSANLSIDVTLARGLNYYTGAIFEVSAPDGVNMGSIGGGGRYDDLTGVFGLKDMSGVGISFGLDRIYIVLEELGLFPSAIDQSLDVLCVNFGDREALFALKLVRELRKSGIKADVYPSSVKMQKQMKYANNRKVPFVILIGEQELESNSFVVKNMKEGSQGTYSLDKVEEFINSF